MKLKRPLAPQFLKNIDRQLLLNEPGVWSTRTHLVIYYGLIFIVLLGAVCFVTPADPRGYPVSGYWAGFVVMLSIIALVVWLIYLLRFNIFKRYGDTGPWYAFVNFLLYFIATVIIVLFPYVPAVIETIKTNRVFSDDEIVRDINTINTRICELEKNSLQFEWRRDTVEVVENLIPNRYKNNPNIESAPSFPSRKIDRDIFERRLAETDSSVKINDSLFVLYHTPSYNFVNPYLLDNGTGAGLLSAFDLYKNVVRSTVRTANPDSLRNELAALLRKYRYQEPGTTSYTEFEESLPSDHHSVILRKYHIENINQSINNIIEKKHRWDKQKLPAHIRLVYYFTLITALSIFIFRHTTTKTFFLTILTAALLTIFTALLISVFPHSDNTFFIWISAYAALFFLGSLSVWTSKTRKAVPGILSNLFVLLVPFLPLIAVGWYNAYRRARFSFYENDPIATDLEWYALYAEIGGALLLLVLLRLYINRLYRKWYALPEE